MYVNQITLPSQFSPSTYTPTFDEVGLLLTNHITGERQRFAANNTSKYTFIMPSYAPFFGATMVVSSVIAGVVTPLVLDVDYVLCFPFLGASRAIKQQIYGGILFTGIGYSGTVQLDYQTLGGAWVTGQVKNAATLINVLSNPAIVAMEQVSAYATPFPVINSAWDRTDPTALSQINDQLAAIEQNVANKAVAQNYNATTAHLVNQHNPHQLTLTQLGLNLVANLPPASNIDAKDITNNSKYISAAQVSSMMKTGVTKATATVQGVVELNMGSYVGDDSSQLKTLTAVGFAAMAANNSSAIGAAVGKGQIQGFVTPFPYIFPIGWNGNIYYTQSQFNHAVEAAVSVSPLEFDINLGCFWFPANTAVPSLVLTSSH